MAPKNGTPTCCSMRPTTDNSTGLLPVQVFARGPHAYADRNDMNAEPFSMSEPTARLGRIAILWRGDEAARRSARPETSRFKAVFAALADVGVDAEPVVYEDDVL